MEPVTINTMTANSTSSKPVKAVRFLKAAAILFLAVLTIGLSTVQMTRAGALSDMLSSSSVPIRYQKDVQTGGPIEAKYIADGPYQVSKHENNVLQDFQKYTTYYPSELETANKKYPVIVLCNGTGVPFSKYTTLARHYASWGFLVIGTEEQYSWNAFGAEMSIRYLELMNNNKQVDNKDSVFYQKVDFGNVGVVGHSQGGVGAINAITDTKHKDIYKTAVALSPANMQLASNLLWDYAPSQIKIPILLASGAGGGDDIVVNGEQLQAIYDEIKSDKVMMRRKNTPHGQMLYSADGYVTAWLMWQLQGDSEAAKAFTGKNPEILSNTMYQDQKIVLK